MPRHWGDKPARQTMSSTCFVRYCIHRQKKSLFNVNERTESDFNMLSFYYYLKPHKTSLQDLWFEKVVMIDCFVIILYLPAEVPGEANTLFHFKSWTQSIETNFEDRSKSAERSARITY